MEVVNGEAQPHPVHQPKEQPSLARWLFSATATNGRGSDTIEPAGSSSTEENGTSANKPDTAPYPVALNVSASESSAIPPYWRHYRKESQASQASTDLPRKPFITLEDHTENSAYDPNKGLWAKGVSIDDYHVVNGKSGIGAYIVWTCRIETLSGVPTIVRMRYSEFVNLRDKLAATFPHAKKSMPSLPPKSPFFKFNSRFLESRRVGLAYFLNCVVLNPEFAGSPLLKEILFTHST